MKIKIYIKTTMKEEELEKRFEAINDDLETIEEAVQSIQSNLAILKSAKGNCKRFEVGKVYQHPNGGAFMCTSVPQATDAVGFYEVDGFGFVNDRSWIDSREAPYIIAETHDRPDFKEIPIEEWNEMLLEKAKRDYQEGDVVRSMLDPKKSIIIKEVKKMRPNNIIYAVDDSGNVVILFSQNPNDHYGKWAEKVEAEQPGESPESNDEKREFKVSSPSVHIDPKKERTLSYKKFVNDSIEQVSAAIVKEMILEVKKDLEKDVERVESDYEKRINNIVEWETAPTSKPKITYTPRYSETDEPDEKGRWARIAEYNRVRVGQINRDPSGIYVATLDIPTTASDVPHEHLSTPKIEEARGFIQERLEWFLDKIGK